MRIVYDDSKQTEMVSTVIRFMKHLSVGDILKYEYGMKRVQMMKLKEMLDVTLSAHDMSIGNTVTHKYGIGNNRMYPVYYHPYDVEEIQQCGYISLNVGLYGEGYVYCEDYNGKKITPSYDVSKWGVRVLSDAD